MPVSGCTDWKKHKFQIGDFGHETDDLREAQEMARHGLANKIATLLRSEHLNLLVGNGLTLAVASQCGAAGSDLKAGQFKAHYAEAVHRTAEESAAATERGAPNLEDDIRAALQLLGGLRVLAKIPAAELPPSFEVLSLLTDWETALGEVLTRLAKSVLATEEGIKNSLGASSGHAALKQLASLLLAFGMRPSSRERLHIFTTNYDRLLEYACDLLGIQVLDRFVGRLEPMFRASRLNVDLHYVNGCRKARDSGCGLRFLRWAWVQKETGSLERLRRI